MSAECPDCGKRCADRNGVYLHMKAKHGKRPAREYREQHSDDDESMADIMVRAQIKRAMGVRNEDWIEDMLP